MKRMMRLILAALTLTVTSCETVPAMGRRPVPGGQTLAANPNPAFIQAIGTNQASFVQGGTVADAGLFNGPVMLEAAGNNVKSAPARVVIGFNFGADQAPEVGTLDEKTSTLKNDIGRVIDAAKGNPYAGAAVAALQAADKALTPPKPQPLGDRAALQGFILFEGESRDAKDFGVAGVRTFGEVRQSAHGTPRAEHQATASETLTVTNDAAVVTTLGLSYLEYLQAEEDAEDPAKVEAPPAPKPTPAPTPAPVGDGVSDDARAAAWYPNVLRGGGNNAAVAAGGGKRFLWKPVSNSNGKAAVHTPNNHYVSKLEVLTSGGEVVESHGVGSIGNGYRPLFRLSKPGTGYEAGTKVRLVPSGLTIAIPNPGTRFEKDGFPAYSPQTAEPTPSPVPTPAPASTNAVPPVAVSQNGVLRVNPALLPRIVRAQVVHTRNGFAPAFDVSGVQGAGIENGFQWINFGKSPDGVWNAGKPLSQYPTGKRGGAVWLVTGDRNPPFGKDGNLVVEDS